MAPQPNCQHAHKQAPTCAMNTASQRTSHRKVLDNKGDSPSPAKRGLHPCHVGACLRPKVPKLPHLPDIAGVGLYRHRHEAPPAMCPAACHGSPARPPARPHMLGADRRRRVWNPLDFAAASHGHGITGAISRCAGGVCSGRGSPLACCCCVPPTTAAAALVRDTVSRPTSDRPPVPTPDRPVLCRPLPPPPLTPTRLLLLPPPPPPPSLLSLLLLLLLLWRHGLR